MIIPSWAQVEREAKRRIDGLKESLMSCQPDDLTRLQASIKAWNDVLKLPQTLAKPEDEGDSGLYRT